MFYLEEEIKCPACGAWISAKESKCCPVCGLENLDRIFLSKDDREQWIETVLNPHIASGNWDSVRASLLWGKKHMLGLSSGGHLYGIGSNMSKQIKMDSEQESFDAPVLLCKNVRAAAASLHYSVFVTYDGKLQMQGYAADIAGRYQENSIKEKVRDVVASTEEDSFWAITVSGKVYFWGKIYYNNELMNAGLMPKPIDVEVYVFPEEIKYENYPGEPVYAYDYYSHRSFLLYSTSGYTKYEKSMYEFQRSSVYLSFCEEYGEKNVRLEWMYSSPGHKKMKVMRKNNIIFVPELMQGSAEELKRYSLNVESLSEVSGQSAEKLKKYIKTVGG